MYVGVNNHNRFRRHLHHHGLNEDDVVAVDPQPASAGSLRRHIAASLIQHHQSSERNKHPLQPLSPASYGSSLEIAPYNPAATPDSSIALRGKIGDSSYSFKTSTELLKVLNRIWSLEEQHASNVSLIIKHELDLARVRIKELVRDQQANHHEIEELMKQFSEDNLARESKERECLDAALQLVRKELDDERKLRKRSESLHRKLGRELFQVKVALSSSIKELEKERKSNELLEKLCDEFAKGLVHAVRQRSNMNWTSGPYHDNLVLHLSESWLDERMQMKDNTAQNSSVVDKLGHEIENFLATRQRSNTHEGNKDIMLPTNTKDRHSRLRSLESIPEACNAPKNLGCEESGLTDQTHNTNAGPSTFEKQEELVPRERTKGQTPPSVQLSDPRNTPREINLAFMNEEISMLQKSDVYDSLQRKKTSSEEGHGSNSKAVDKPISDYDYEYKEVSSSNNAVKRNVSPIRQWLTSMKSLDPRISESCIKTQQVKDGNNTLKSKLQEPKVKGQRSRLRILKGSS